MNIQPNSVLDLLERIKRKAPEYFDLIVAETDKEFETAFDAVLDSAVRHLETNRKNFKKLDEKGLCAALAGRLTIPGLTVDQEKNSNGHVDLTITADHCVPARVKLAEAKIYDGPAYHIQGLEQLIGRYSTGSEGRGLIINFVRTRDINGLVEKLRSKLDQDLPLKQQGPSQEHILKWSFLTVHTHGSGEGLEVGHIGCNLYDGK